MANICSNYLTFSGDEYNLKLADDFLELVGEANHRNDAYNLLTDEGAVDIFFRDLSDDLSASGGGFSYCTRWIPNIEAVIAIAKRFRLSFELEYEELGNGHFGKYVYDSSSEEYVDYSLDGGDFDVKNAAETEPNSYEYLYKGKEYSSEYDILSAILEDKIVKTKKVKAQIGVTPTPTPTEMTVELMNMTEKEYRAYPAVSYSRLSDIEKVGILAVNADVNNIGKLRGVVLGSIVDDVISNKLTDVPDYVKVVDKIPGSGTVTEKAINALIDRFSFVNFIGIDKDKLEHFLGSNGFMINGMSQSNFHGKLANYQEYINALKANQGSDVQIVTKFDLSIAKKAIKRLRKLVIFGEDFVNNSDREIHYQIKLLAKANGIEIKCMLDALQINHITRTIDPMDIKTGALSDGGFDTFFFGAYIKYNYYIQAGLYRKILVEYFKNDPVYKDYTVTDFSFIYSTTNPKSALSEEALFIHIVDKKMYLESFKGFEYTENGTKILKQGIGSLLSFYKKHKTPVLVELEPLSIP